MIKFCTSPEKLMLMEKEPLDVSRRLILWIGVRMLGIY